jgi:hypothetical protein
LQPENNIMSKKIGDLEINDSEFINSSLMDFYADDSDDILDGNTEEDFSDETTNTTVDTSTTLDFDQQTDDDEEEETTTEEEEEDDDDSTEKPEPSETDSLEDYNTLALLTLSLKDQDLDLIDFDVPKDIDAESLVNNLKNRITKLKEETENSVKEQYAEAAEYLEMILQGATENQIKQGLAYNQIASMELTGEEDESILEQVVYNWLALKQTPDIPDLIEVYKDKGILLEKAKESVQFHKEQEQIYFDNWKRNRDAEIAANQQRELDLQKNIKAMINKGSLRGLEIKDKKRFEEAMFKPTELIEYIDQTGKKRVEKVPLMKIKLQEFNNDLEQQLAMNMLILDGFDFSSLVEKAKRKVSSNLINTLNDRASVSPQKKQGSSRYFED